jgi:hypothetical protein
VHREFLALVDARARRNVLGADDVDLVCSSSARRQTDPSIAPALPTAAYADSVANAATLACLGHADRRARALRGLLSDDERDVQIAQVYLQYRPLRDAAELRALTAAVARMRGGATQVRALQTLAAMGVSDRESLATLTALYPRARSLDVQRAIAGVLIRADAREIAPADFARTLRQYRLASPDGEDVIDALIRRLQASS